MSTSNKKRDFHSSEPRFAEFQHLMQHRVREILLVSSIYDSFLLAQDGQLRTLLVSEYMELNLPQAPTLHNTPVASEAFDILEEHPNIDIIITTPHTGDLNVLEFAEKLRANGFEKPIALLAFDFAELNNILASKEMSYIDKVFMWQGDFRILLAIVKCFEDVWNVENDTGHMGVQSLLLVEDNIRFYSSYLPMLYTELLKQSQRLISESVNHYHRLLRMRARPKILHADNFEEAWEYFTKYEHQILGMMTDIEFPVAGKKQTDAGPELCRRARELRPDLPIILQSFQPEIAVKARKLGVGFVQKDSPTLLNDMADFLQEHCGFGDFVFRLPDGEEIDRAANLKELNEKISIVPEECLIMHADRDNFSTWLKARTEFQLADKLKPRKISDYPSIDALREDLVDSLDTFRLERSKGQIADFNPLLFDPANQFARIGGGSLGGKARGLAFISHLLTRYGSERQFEGSSIFVPLTVVLCTEVFEKFLAENDLTAYALEADDDTELLKRFLDAEFPEDHIPDLKLFLEHVKSPLAIRSSSLLEDSQFQPFAGIYNTYMLSNCHPDPDVRLLELIAAIKRVYVSTFTRAAKSYITTTPYRLEEERMAVIIQKLVGEKHENRFYPDFAGVARSHNFYPTAPLKSSDGVASVALGLGQTVVEGGRAVRFCPKFPRHLMQFSTVKDMIENSQKTFYALSLENTTDHLDPARDIELPSFRLIDAEKDGTMHNVGSVYSAVNDTVYDGLSRRGVPIVTFAPILKHKAFPLPDILDWLLDLGEWGMGWPVEIEFAVNASVARGELGQFGVLQLRPFVVNRELEDLQIDEVEEARQLCHCHKVLGLGIVDDLKDIVVVDINSYDRSQSHKVAAEVARYNGMLNSEKRPYLLIGVGRWGSADPWLGIPVTWDQISGARVIVETGFKDFKVTPSQGAHFFQNLTALGIGYFTVNPDTGDGSLDWEWLSQQEALSEGSYVRHLRYDEAVTVMMNGHRNQGVILKPGMQSG